MSEGGMEINTTSGGVYSYEDFEKWVDGNPKQRSKALKRIDGLRERLEASDEKIKDPIAFLHDVYYRNESSFRKVLAHEIVGKLYSVKGLRNLLVESFEWVPRKNTDRTPEHALVVDAKVQGGIDEFESQLTALVEGKPVKREFKMRELAAKKYKIQRALYILNTLGGIDRDMLFRISSEGGLGARVLANALNKQLQDILKNFPEVHIVYEDIELTPQSIDKWFIYNADKQAKVNEE